LFKAKKGENIALTLHSVQPQAYIEYFENLSATELWRIYPPPNFGGLKFEPDAGIGQKRAFFKGL